MKPFGEKAKKEEGQAVQAQLEGGYAANGKTDNKYAYGYTEQEAEDNYAALRNSINMGCMPTIKALHIL